MLFRRSAETEEAKTAASPSAVDTGSGKGRPTPSRKEAEARRRSQMTPPKDKREARAREREDRDLVLAKIKAGDERYFPARDRGPLRAEVRNWVDGRRRLTEFLMPVVVVGLLSLVVKPAAPTVLSILMAFYVLAVGDITVTLLGLRRRLARDFAADDPTRKGAINYAFQRMLQARKRRLPPPVVDGGWLRRNEVTTG
jgi:hypothetical protein